MTWKDRVAAALVLAGVPSASAANVECQDCWSDRCLDLRESGHPQCPPDSSPAPSPVPPSRPTKPSASTSAPGIACPSGMALVPGGSFTLGDRRDRATIGSLCMDATEVTVAAYTQCVRQGRCTPASTVVDWPGITEPVRISASAFCNGDRPERQDHPVNCVDWNQALSYCDAVAKRLPTEDEWEWAARGGTKGTRYPWGNAQPADQLCWNRGGDDAQGTCPVGSFASGDNPQGIHDLAGNVWEWTSSRFNDQSPDRVNRGGGWHIDNPIYFRAADRSSNVPGFRDFFLGFRCVRSPSSAAPR